MIGAWLSSVTHDHSRKRTPMRSAPSPSRLRAAAAATAIVSLAALAGCSTSPETAELRVWFMEGSVTDEAQEWLISEFESTHEGSTLTIEIQSWDGIVSKLQTAMASDTETPDIVEIGNTQSQTFTTVGAFDDITDITEELGGDDLIQSFVDAGSYEGANYTLPLYGGARAMVYRADLFEQLELEVPSTLAELNETAETLTDTNPEGVDGFKAVYLAGVDTGSLNSWLFGAGGQYAEQNSDGSWSGTLSSPASQEGALLAQELLTNWALGAQDSNDVAWEPWNDFNAGRVAMFAAQPWYVGNIDAELLDNGAVGAFVIPGTDPDAPGQAFAGGSNIGISARSSEKELARDVMRLIYSAEFMGSYSALGVTPGNTALADPDAAPVFGDVFAEATATSTLTPPAVNWAVVESENIPGIFWQAIARGEDTAQAAASADAKISEILND